ncbi:MAG: WYL domain-containing protein [Sideroxydans sp.]|nr:WYL domain-containing protein [Sideroxydans sp.]
MRQWQTLRLIPRHPRKITASELCANLQADGFVVGKRTVERDLQSLGTIFPIVSDERSKPYGWCWQSNAPTFDLPGISNSAAIALLLARDHLHTLLPISTLAQLHPYFALAEKKLSTLEQHTQITGWQHKVRVIPATQPLLPPAIEEEVQATIYEALLMEKQCLIAYQKRDATEPENYPVHTLGLVQRGQILYLVCTIRTYPHLRLLALHRIKAVALLDDATVPPVDFDLDAYIASSAFGWMPKESIKLKAIFVQEAAAHLYETPLETNQALFELEDGRIQLEATVQETLQLRWWLQGFGDAVEVVEPKQLRQQMADSAKRLVDRYENKAQFAGAQMQ